MRTITRRHEDHVRAEHWECELIGGAHDGTRLVLQVVRDGPNEIRVLETGYSRPAPTLKASDVEQR